jgi:hypothetical protein
MDVNGIRHIKSVVYHPATNGLAERFVQTLKNALKSAQRDAGTMKKKLANFLLTYRNTPHTTTNETPAQLFIGRPLRMRLDLLKPDTESRVHHNQFKVMTSESSHRLREFAEGQAVTVRDYRGRDKWMAATVLKRNGPLTYQVKPHVAPQSIWRRHVDQMRAGHATQPPQMSTNDIEPATAAAARQPTAATAAAAEAETSATSTIAAAAATSSSGQGNQSGMEAPPSESVESSAGVTERRYPVRDRKPPDRLIEHMND